MKRLIPLLVLAIALTAAPSAMAACLRCDPLHQSCKGTPVFGFVICEFVDPGCFTDQPCGGLAPEIEPLASEFTVASVERIDQREAPASQMRIADLKTPQPQPAVR